VDVVVGGFSAHLGGGRRSRGRHYAPMTSENLMVVESQFAT
jgi:hypothetical protein